jgi:hypothetical protein
LATRWRSVKTGVKGLDAFQVTQQRANEAQQVMSKRGGLPSLQICVVRHHGVGFSMRHQQNYLPQRN